MELQTHPPPFRSTAEAAAQQNQITMGVLQLKEILHLRIEQADEKFLKVLAAMTEVYFQEHEPEVIDETREMEIEAYEASLKPMTVDELVARAEASNEDIKAGRVHTREEVMAELGI